jgi:hypothetical protein
MVGELLVGVLPGDEVDRGVAGGDDPGEGAHEVAVGAPVSDAGAVVERGEAVGPRQVGHEDVAGVVFAREGAVFGGGDDVVD